MFASTSSIHYASAILTVDGATFLDKTDNTDLEVLVTKAGFYRSKEMLEDGDDINLNIWN